MKPALTKEMGASGVNIGWIIDCFPMVHFFHALFNHEPPHGLLVGASVIAECPMPNTESY